VPHILVASDSDRVIEDVTSALGDDHTTFVVCHSGQEALRVVGKEKPDLAVLDMQIGNMGGVAVCMDLRLEEGAHRLPYVPVLLLLDRKADIFLARRAGAEAWLIKPLDSFRLRRAAAIAEQGEPYQEGVPEIEVVHVVEENPSDDDEATG
jgi:two-component system nitrate/nitrite response regulator NarL